MALDRQSIEKRDFPIGRRGYEPAAVDAHLQAIAAQVEELQRASQRRGAESLASAASEQVRAIVEAAESSAADIERQAQADAQRIHQEATREADRARADAIERAQEHVARVSEATTLMLQRVDAMESELGALMESLRTGANRLNADLSLLEGNMGELYGAASRGTAPAAVPEPTAGGLEPAGDEIPEAAEVAAPDVDESVAYEPGGEADGEAAVAVADDDGDAGTTAGPEGLSAEPAPEPAGATGTSPGSADAEGARLIALNMALNGQSREETDRYLAENFDLDDRDALLDEVYASVES